MFTCLRLVVVVLATLTVFLVSALITTRRLYCVYLSMTRRCRAHYLDGVSLVSALITTRRLYCVYLSTTRRRRAHYLDGVSRVCTNDYSRTV